VHVPANRPLVSNASGLHRSANSICAALLLTLVQMQAAMGELGCPRKVSGVETFKDLIICFKLSISLCAPALLYEVVDSKFQVPSENVAPAR